MKNYLFLAVLLFMNVCLWGQGPTLESAQVYNQSGNLMATEDNDGNTVVVGNFSFWIDLDPGPDTARFVGFAGGSVNFFIQKLDPQGKFIWGRAVQTISLGTSISVVDVHITSKNDIIVAGSVFGSGGHNFVVSDSSRTRILQNRASSSGYILKVSENGDLLWERPISDEIGSTSHSSSLSAIKLDSEEHIIVGGSYTGAGNFDPDPNTGITELGSLGNPVLRPPTNFFVLKMDSLGRNIWARSGKIVNRFALPVLFSDLVLNTNDNIYFTFQNFPDSIFIGSPSGPDMRILNPTTQSRGALFKFNRDGSLGFAKSLEVEARSIVLGHDNNLTIVGRFSGPVDLDPDPQASYILNTTGFSSDGYIAQYDSAGVFRWAGKVGGGEDDFLSRCEVAPDGSILTVGAFNGHGDFDPGPGVRMLPNSGPDFGMIMQRYEPNGDLIWTSVYSDPFAEVLPRNLYITEDGDILFTAGWKGTVDFDPGPESLFFTANFDELILLRLSQGLCSKTGVIITNASPITCDTVTGSAEAKGIGGKAPYTYRWLPDKTPDSVLSTNVAGLHQVQVVDANGCLATREVDLGRLKSATKSDWTVSQSSTAFRSGFATQTWLNAANLGCGTGSNILHFVKPPLLTLDSATVEPDRQAGDSLFWDLTSYDFDTGNFRTRLSWTVSRQAAIGDTICMPLWVATPNDDIDSTNNYFIDYHPVINSYDPNDILVSPAGFCDRGVINSQETLTYTIRFQNTGNAEAINVLLADTLSEYLDITTLNVLSQSHEPMKVHVQDEHQLFFQFDGINLPDSASNEALSHGYVIFEIKAKDSLSSGSVIENKADIYFDFNPPIRTNTVINTLINAELVEGFDQIGDTLFARQGEAAGYQWFECKNIIQPIPGATNRTFVPTQNGAYALEVDLYGCTVTTSCLSVSGVGIDGIRDQPFEIFPNPTSGLIHIELDRQYPEVYIEVTDLSGRMLQQQAYSQTTSIDLKLDAAPGMYLIHIHTPQGGSSWKVLKR